MCLREVASCRLLFEFQTAKAEGRPGMRSLFSVKLRYRYYTRLAFVDNCRNTAKSLRSCRSPNSTPYGRQSEVRKEQRFSFANHVERENANSAVEHHSKSRRPKFVCPSKKTPRSIISREPVLSGIKPYLQIQIPRGPHPTECDILALI